jgi:transposase
MTPAEYYAEEHRNLLRASNAALAQTVRNRHNPDCACGQDEALTEPINQKDTE